MKNKQYILFDLDGTIIDSSIGIIYSIEHALNKMGIEVEDTSTLRAFIGPVLTESFKKYYNFDEDTAKKAVVLYREMYSTKGMYDITMYNGILELIKLLKQNNKKVILATAKPEPYAKAILEHLQIAQYFDFICGSNLDYTRSKKSEIIQEIINNYPKINRENTIMIGDREHDIVGAHENNIQCISVLYGFGDRQEFENAKTDYIVDTTKCLQKLLVPTSTE